MVGPKKQNQYTQKKSLYFENKGSASSSKIGHDFKKLSGSKIKVVYFEKIPSIFDNENWL